MIPPEIATSFLPYQRRWLKDRSEVKVWQKTRRGGMTWVAAAEDVIDCGMKRVPETWFTSSDDTAGQLFIDYVAWFARKVNLKGQEVKEYLYDSENEITSRSVLFANGTSANALSSNPKQFRSKGGKGTLDEFAWHEDPMGLLRAATPITTWGYPLRILSSHNGKQSLFYRLTEEIQKKTRPWSLHTTDIHLAIKEGLFDKIKGKKTTTAERLAFMEKLRANCPDEESWQQEYCCVPVDEATAFLTYEMIRASQRADCLKPLHECKGPLFAGIDFARTRHFTVLWVMELVGAGLVTRQITALKNRPFDEQNQLIDNVMAHPNLIRLCGDRGNMGWPLLERAQKLYGKTRVEPVQFTGPIKERLAFDFKAEFDDKKIVTPPDFEMTESLHAIRKLVTAAGHTRFDAPASDSFGHGDHFWAGALATQAARGGDTGRILIASRPRGWSRKGNLWTRDAVGKFRDKHIHERFRR